MRFHRITQNNALLDLHVKNLSQKTIVFYPDSAVTIFTENGGNWVPVLNNEHYPSEILNLLPTNKFPPGLVINTFPYIPGLIESKVIRIIVIGHYENAADELLGAYLDIKINP